MPDITTLGAVIKSTYEGEANTNAFTDAEKSKLAGIQTGAEVNAVDSVNGQTGAVIVDVPVQSVNGQTGEVLIAVPTELSELDNDTGFITASDAPVQSVNGQTGDVTITIPTALSELDNDTNFITVAEAPVQSVAGKTGVVTLAKGDVGLGNVDNTSDANKPVSTATQTALNGKISSDVTGIAGAIAIGNIVQISQEDYDALDPSIQNANTFLIPVE